ncbi:hypothetical protein [Thermoactinomyces sp. DSM 45892]|uniref:hypothetical protein n=1 Tax=Thermoactinomyces sp. DSM 45892 TaxID=1882753 RepID=UPI00089B6B5D|nr:hypothetical protein [Thermoactinomyces sp. DSM 45892]SDY84080.1 hypothetical protein SAMN05444416_10944 [Thermoactinomyces sp. DSM 45892]
MEFKINDVWFGRIGTAYEGVTATIQAITERKIQVSFDRVVAVDGMMLGGCIFGKKQFQELFEQVYWI